MWIRIDQMAGTNPATSFNSGLYHKSRDFRTNAQITLSSLLIKKHNFNHRPPTAFQPLLSRSNMGSVGPSLSFNVLRDTKPEDKSLPAFMVSTTRGFLPRSDPIVKLPAEFDVLESILTRMPIKTLDGTPGI